MAVEVYVGSDVTAETERVGRGVRVEGRGNSVEFVLDQGHLKLVIAPLMKPNHVIQGCLEL